MADRIDDGQFHDLLGQQAQRPIGEPLGRLAQPQRDDLRFLLAIQLFLARWGLRFFTVQREQSRRSRGVVGHFRPFLSDTKRPPQFLCLSSWGHSHRP